MKQQKCTSTDCWRIPTYALYMLKELLSFQGTCNLHGELGEKPLNNFLVIHLCQSIDVVLDISILVGSPHTVI